MGMKSAVSNAYKVNVVIKIMFVVNMLMQIKGSEVINLKHYQSVEMCR